MNTKLVCSFFAVCMVQCRTTFDHVWLISAPNSLHLQVILFALVNLVFAQYGPEFDGGAMQPQGDGEEYGAAQPDFEGGGEMPYER